MSELRIDPLTREWVAILVDRQDRPNLAPGGAGAASCPFCVGGLEAPEPYTVRAFENRWPPFAPGDPIDTDDALAHGTGFVSLPARGAAEIVLYSPDHSGSLATIGVPGARRVVDLWADRTEALLARPEIEYVHVFENRGALVGATIPHPHGQIYGFPFVPPVPQREAAVAAEHGCPVCAALRNEVADGTRIVRDERGWVTYVPFASAYPYGVIVAPHDHLDGLPALEDASRDGLAAALVEIVSRYDGLFDAEMPYLMWVHHGVHVHLHFAPPLRAADTQRFVASGEVGSGTYGNPVAPEAAAAALRGI
ncbi:MAG: galactose-1-phosphate uridylyltransferase [Acidimicrobiia bacterium]